MDFSGRGARLTFVWFASFAIISVILAYIQNLDGQWEIARDPHATTGVIISTDCENHALVHYRYQISGNTYLGKASRTINCEKLEVNDQIRIFYAGDDPGTNELYDPQKTLISAVIFTGTAAFFLSSMIVLAFF